MIPEGYLVWVIDVYERTSRSIWRREIKKKKKNRSIVSSGVGRKMIECDKLNCSFSTQKQLLRVHLVLVGVGWKDILNFFFFFLPPLLLPQKKHSKFPLEKKKKKKKSCHLQHFFFSIQILNIQKYFFSVFLKFLLFIC